MSEPSAISAILEPIALVGRGLASVHWSWYLSHLGRVLVLPWRIIAVPLSFIFSIILVILSPVLHILSYILSWLNAVLAFFVSLEVSSRAPHCGQLEWKLTSRFHSRSTRL